MLLEALVACAGVTLRAVATAIGVELRDAKVMAEGDLDFRGTLGVCKEAPVGFRDIRLTFELDTDASEEQRAIPAEADRALLRRPPDPALRAPRDRPSSEGVRPRSDPEGSDPALTQGSRPGSDPYKPSDSARRPRRP